MLTGMTKYVEIYPNTLVKKADADQSYAKQLNDIANVYNSLPEEKKNRCILYWNGTYLQKSGASRFSAVYITASGNITITTAIMSTTLSNCHWFTSNNGATPTDMASQTDSTEIIMYCD